MQNLDFDSGDYGNTGQIVSRSPCNYLTEVVLVIGPSQWIAICKRGKH